MKLVRDSKVKKLPREHKTVRGHILGALDKAQKQGWKYVIIIGEGKENGHWRCSPMDTTTAIGMLEMTKNHILNGE